MDYPTAFQYLLTQALISPNAPPDAFLACLHQGKPPVPGQVTSILLALKVVSEAMKGVATIDRALACALYLLAYDSRQQFDQHQRAGVLWPPLLNEDLKRIANGVELILIG